MGFDKTRHWFTRHARLLLLLVLLVGLGSVGAGAAWSSVPLQDRDRILNAVTQPRWLRAVLYTGLGPWRFAPSGEDFGDGGPPGEAALLDPASIWVDDDGRIFISERYGHRIRVLSDGIIETFAGIGRPGFNADGIPAAESRLSFPEGITGSADGSLYVADASNDRVRRIDENGIISTVAGTGRRGFSGDGGPAAEADLAQPSDLCFGPDGSLFIADRSNFRIRRLSPDGIIETVVGTGDPGFSGDGGSARNATIGEVWGLACGPDGTLYIADTGNHRVRSVDAAGIIRTIAGSGAEAYGGDGGPALEASLSGPQALFVAPDGALWIDDEHNNRIRRIDADGIIRPVAGTGVAGPGGDGGPALQAQLNDPEDIWVYPSGSFLIADGDNNRVRLVDTAGVILAAYGGGTAETPGLRQR